MPFFVTVRQNGQERKIEYSGTVRLIDVIAESGFGFDLPCGGRGVCGNCRVIARGSLTEPTVQEKEFLRESLSLGMRLACLAGVKGEAVIDIPKNYVPTFDICDISTDISPITGSKKCFACAVDVGTTTVAFRYYSLPDGKLVFCDSAANPQRIRGADVLTRIEFASNGGLEELKALIEKTVAESAERFGQKIEFYTITGNTAMLHIMAGKDPKGLAVAPFKPESLFGFWDRNRYYMRCASSYIGSDIVASLLASGITKKKSRSILLDIGTNNECVLWDGEKLLACSSPAGPAFEGANISCGVTARSGAICKVWSENGEPRFETVAKGEKPIGFCGSGLIDAVAFLLENGHIASDGSVIRSLPYFGSVRLEPQDIAELQLAKSAVCAGILTLPDEAGVSIEQLENIYLTGSFGGKLNQNSAERIGMIPKGTAAITHITGCGAVEGASMALLSENALKESEKIACNIKTIELADSRFFEKAFLENMWF